MNQIEAVGFYFIAPNAPLERREWIVAEPGADEVVVEVAGCGLCHTDLSFITGAVKTNHPPPLVLGHEISGRVVASGDRARELRGKAVIVPAVLPCGDCDLCRRERDNICRHQRMPGNDFSGGFATHLTVPARSLCVVPDDLGRFQLAELAVVADAITTPYQSLRRSGLRPGDLAIVVGVGGIGTYLAQLARAEGAAVIAIDVDEARLSALQEQGIEHVVAARGMTSRDVKGRVRALVKAHDLPQHGWRVFETSGTAAGQETAFALLSFAGTLGIVGFTMDKVALRLSNVMAFDADLFGNWGCRPQYYPDVVDLVLRGQIELKRNIELHPLESIGEVIDRALRHELPRRAILMPRQGEGKP